MLEHDDTMCSTSFHPNIGDVILSDVIQRLFTRDIPSFIFTRKAADFLQIFYKFVMSSETHFPVQNRTKINLNYRRTSCLTRIMERTSKKGKKGGNSRERK